MNEAILKITVVKQKSSDDDKNLYKEEQRQHLVKKNKL